jgi:hypothetical protein
MLLVVASINTTLSSANKRCVIVGPSLPNLTPASCASACAWRSSAEKPSTQNKNRYGDSGSPWRKPLEGEKESEITPFNFTVNLTDITHLMIISTHCNEKPIRVIIFLKKLHSTLS